MLTKWRQTWLCLIFLKKNLKGFTTTEKDMKRGVTRFPPENFRNTKNDMLKETPVASQKQVKEVEFGNIDQYGNNK